MSNVIDMAEAWQKRLNKHVASIVEENLHLLTVLVSGYSLSVRPLVIEAFLEVCDEAKSTREAICRAGDSGIDL